MKREQTQKIKSNRKKYQDETAYLLSSPANAEHLQKAIKEANKGEVVKISLDEIIHIKKAFKLADKVKSGKVKSRPASEFLDEL